MIPQVKGGVDVRPGLLVVLLNALIAGCSRPQHQQAANRALTERTLENGHHIVPVELHSGMPIIDVLTQERTLRMVDRATAKRRPRLHETG
jgi:hypothetical protein